MEDDGALFPTASRKGWLNVRSKSPFAVWKRRWLVLTHDKLHICRKIGVCALLCDLECRSLKSASNHFLFLASRTKIH